MCLTRFCFYSVVRNYISITALCGRGELERQKVGRVREKQTENSGKEISLIQKEERTQLTEDKRGLFSLSITLSDICMFYAHSTKNLTNLRWHNGN